MTAPLTLDAVCADVAETAALPLEKARTLPKEAYTDPAFFELEKDKAMKTGWICVAHVSQLKKPGSFLAIDLFDEPLLVVRGRDEEVRVITRVCAHRGIDIMPDDADYPRKGETRLLTCPYHAWVYELDGSLRGCPHMQEAEGFKREDWKLTPFRSEIWNGFVFVNMDGMAAPLAEQFAEFDGLIAPWHCEDLEVVIELEWECDFNWKVMIENWMESYHHIGAHATTLNPIMPGETTWTDPERAHFVKAHLPYNAELKAAWKAAQEAGESDGGLPPIEGLTEEQATEWGLYVGLPFFMFLTTNDRVIWYRLLPTAVDRCQLLTTTLARPEVLEVEDRDTILEKETALLRGFHMEDMVINAAMQKGLRSDKVQRGRLSHLEEPIWLIQRWLAARLAGTYPTPADRKPYYGPKAERAPLQAAE